MNKNAHVIKKLAELGIDTTPTKLSPELADLVNQLNKYQDEFNSLDPKQLKKYLRPFSSNS